MRRGARVDGLNADKHPCFQVRGALSGDGCLSAFMKYHKGDPLAGDSYDPASSEADCECPFYKGS